MSEELLVMHCAPTLAGLKTGNLFTTTYQNEAELLEEIRRLNRLLAPKGLRVIPMREIGDRALIYVYRPSKLKRDFLNCHVATILRDMGYPYENPEQCVAHMTRKLRENQAFPHEIGLFLGYPPEDVQGFIENRASCFKYIGCWKVYGDVELAQVKFRRYKKCTDVYYAQWMKGFSIEKLTVAV